MGVFEKIAGDDYEQIVYCQDSKVGLKAIIAIHNSALGPATGGCRLWNYRNEEEALTDVLRLAKGMTYKASISDLALGGGKSIIIGDRKSPELLKRFGEFVQTFGGHYITAKDVGIDSADLKLVKSKTPHVLGIEGEANSSGDPSPVTAWGVYQGMRAAAQVALGNSSLKGLHVALQGLGAVNYSLAKYLHAEGAKLSGCDIDKSKAESAHKEFGLNIVRAEEIYDVSVDVFSPGALGAILNSQTIPRLRCKVVAGAANNQLATENDGELLMKRGIFYAPDYAINAGGLINVCHEREGYNKERAWKHVERIFDTIKMVLERSASENKTPSFVANRIAEERVRKAELARK